jgi:hypothetical protein
LVTDRWVDRDEGHFCTAHNYAFARGTTCRGCKVDPGPPIAATPKSVIDREAVAAEAEVRKTAIETKKTAESLMADDPTVGLKAIDVYLKAMRLWREMRTERLQVESDAELLEHDRRMAGHRGSN